MPEKKYIVAGNLYDFEDLEHFGYTETPTVKTDFISSSYDDSFGNASGRLGLYRNSTSGMPLEDYERYSTFFSAQRSDGWGDWLDLTQLDSDLELAPNTCISIPVYDKDLNEYRALSCLTNGSGSLRYFNVNGLFVSGDRRGWISSYMFQNYRFSIPTECTVQLSVIPITDIPATVTKLETLLGVSHAEAQSLIDDYVNSGYQKGIIEPCDAIQAGTFARDWNKTANGNTGGRAKAVIYDYVVSYNYGMMSSNTAGPEKNLKLVERGAMGGIDVDIDDTMIPLPHPINGYMRSY